MNKPPIIGVTSLWDSERKSLWMLPDYMDGIKAAGGVPTHKVMLSGELKALLDKDILEVNTLHHQAIKDLADGLTPMAVTPDGIIEAVMMKNKRFVWAVQWHPEYMFTTDKNSLKIFECFISFAKTIS